VRLLQITALPLYWLALTASCAPVNTDTSTVVVTSRLKYDELFDRLERVDINDPEAVSSSFGVTLLFPSAAQTYRFWQAEVASVESLPALRIEYGERTTQAAQRSNFLSLTISNPCLSIEETRSRYPDMSLVNVSYGHESQGEMVCEVRAGSNDFRLGFEGDEVLLRTISVVRHAGS
jgi:hypothetical protein